MPCVIDQFSCSRTGLPCDGPVLVLPRDVGYVLGEGHTLHILFDLQLPVFIACGVAPLDYVQAFQITDSVKFFRGLVYCAYISAPAGSSCEASMADEGEEGSLMVLYR